MCIVIQIQAHLCKGSVVEVRNKSEEQTNKRPSLFFRQSGFHQTISDGNISRIGVLLPTPSF